MVIELSFLDGRRSKVQGTELFVLKAGGVSVEAAMVTELPFLNGLSKVQGTDIFVLVEKEGA
eukprot:gene14281-20257_t